VDPLIQNPLNSQNLNGYSYVLNNPLSGVDPTGYECSPVDKDTAGCVDSNGNIISQPQTAPPGQNGQQGQGVDAADRGPAADQGRPGRPISDCGGGSCVTLPNTVKRQVIGGEVHFDFDFDFTGSAPPDDGKTSLGTGTGSGTSVRVTPDQAKALDGARIVGTALSGAAGAVKAALGRLFRGVASRASGALSAAFGRITGKQGALNRVERAAARGAPKLLNPARNFAEGQLEKHFAKHAGEWGAGNITKQGYLKRAQDLLSRQPGGDILGHTRAGGDILRYNARTNEFAVGAADGTIRTLFRPTDGMAYWLRQVAP
jgi:hypothetical protein